LTIIPVEVGPLATNAYLVKDPHAGLGAVIDPGGEGERLARRCLSEDIEPLYIVNTHAHLDHTGANAALKDAFPRAQLCIGARDADTLTDPGGNLAYMLGMPPDGPSADVLLSEGDRVTFGSVSLRVIETPGHTAGGISLVYQGEGPAQVFCGDLVFRRGVGRHDLPGGDWDRLLGSIRTKILILPDETVLWPGHGPATTVGEERRENPYLT
jgi:glyoxylase-like metal-dependent hydrolase (beta-lactamase superfamily II)